MRYLILALALLAVYAITQVRPAVAAVLVHAQGGHR